MRVSVASKGRSLHNYNTRLCLGSRSLLLLAADSIRGLAAPRPLPCEIRGFAKRGSLGAMADARSGFAAAKLADIKNRMSAPAAGLMSALDFVSLRIFLLTKTVV